METDETTVDCFSCGARVPLVSAVFFDGEYLCHRCHLDCTIARARFVK